MTTPSFPSGSEAGREEGFLNSGNHVRLYWQHYLPRAPRATVAVLHGGGDHSGRYAGITAALVRAGYQVLLVDLRGHARSDGRRWHVDTFSDYLTDLDVFMAEARRRADGRRLFLVAHSMGGLVAALWGLTPGRGVAGFALSNPYLRLATRPPALKVLAGRIAGKLVPFLPVRTGLRSSVLTSDPDMQAWTDQDPLYGRTTTPRWLDESTRAQEEARRRSQEFRYPLLVMVGTGDTLADPADGRAFLAAAGSRDKELKVYEGFRHELFNEAGRDGPIGDTVAWIAARAGA